MRTNLLLILPLIFLAQGCVDNSIKPRSCYEGIVIGKIRSWGGGIAVGMEATTFSTHQWRGFENVVEALNISHALYQPGQRIYFTARRATKEEQVFARAADGDESEKPIIFMDQVSSIKCDLQ